MNYIKLNFDKDVMNKCGYAKLNYDCDINEILLTKMSLWIRRVDIDDGNIYYINYSNVLMNSFVCNIFFDIDGVNLNIHLFPKSEVVYCELLTDCNKNTFEELHLTEKTFKYGFVDMTYINYLHEHRYLIAIIIQLDDRSDDISVSKILIYCCGQIIHILRDNYFIKRYLGYNMLIIFLCENVSTLEEIKKIDDFIGEYQQLNINKIINKKIKIEVYDENDKFLSFKNYVSI
jgi:hypothetical protein